METDLAKKKLNQLFREGADFLGCKTPIMGGAMTWVSERNLVSAISEAGGFGVIACGSMSPEDLRNEIKATSKLTDAKFGINLILIHPELEKLIKVCLAEHVSHIILAGGIPSKSLVSRLRDSQVKVICFAPTLPVAKKLIRSGADALVIEGMEAGGHIGPVSTNVLAQEMIPHIHEVPIFVAGGIGRGEAMLSYLEMGAAGCQLGTRFVCATESIAHPNFKKILIHSSARDAKSSVQVDPRFPVIPVRALENFASKNFTAFQNKVIEKFDAGTVTKTEGQLEIEHFWAGALKKAVVDGDVEDGSLMAGQSVGMVNSEQPVREIINELLDQSLDVLKKREF